MPKYSSHRQEEYIKKKHKRRRIKVIIFFVLFFLSIGFLIWIAHRPSLRISEVELSGGVLVTQQEVSTEVIQFISGSYIWVFPKNNALLYPQKKLEKYLKDHFKRIDTIHVDTKNLHTMSVEISERKSEALWCGGVPGETEGEQGQCYFMDANSTIFAEAPQFSGDAYFKYYGLVTTDSPIGLEYMATSTDFAELSNFVQNARRLQIKPEYVVAKDTGEFTLVLAGGGKIYFDNKEPLTKVADNLEALLRTPALVPSTNADLPIDYIDLRFGNKLFYKLK
ncbi:MAG: hypothetical protein V4473_02625 [Patescibacteria group bacterium]